MFVVNIYHIDILWYDCEIKTDESRWFSICEIYMYVCVNTHIHIYIHIYSHRPKDESARRIVRLAGVADRKLRRHGSTIARVDSYCYRYRKRPIHPIAKLYT